MFIPHSTPSHSHPVRVEVIDSAQPPSAVKSKKAMVPTSNIPKNAKEQRRAESNNVLSELQRTNQLLATLVHRVEKTEKRVEKVEMTINSSVQ